MAISLFAPAVAAAAAVAAFAFAPIAAADEGDEPSRPGPGQRSAQQDVAKEAPRAVKRDTAKAGAQGAPKAGAQGAPKAGAQDVPKGWENEALWSRPGPAGASPNLGPGPKPPIFALD